MDVIFDPLNLILAAVAMFVVWRLWTVLGSRTGHQGPPAQPLPEPKSIAQDRKGKVLDFPGNKNKDDADAAREVVPAAPIWTSFAAEGTPLAQGLAQINAADPRFVPQAFLDGAKVAYEMVLEAFARGDKPTLKSLLSREVFDGFVSAVDARQKRGETLSTQFIGFKKVEFVSANLKDRKAIVAVRFVSDLLSATKDKAGATISGNPAEVTTSSDVWSFERDVNQRDPNWRVASTEVAA
jgi:predicted lipid-binding transport protein (Tim44 family)